MALDSAIFFVFLGCVAILQSHLPERGRIALLLIASLTFYALSSVGYLLLLFVLCTVNYGLLLRLSSASEPRQRTWLFGWALAANLAVLLTFKYASELLGGLTSTWGWPGEGGKVARLAVPLGLSYFTFQMLACVTDSYRQSWQMEKGFPRFALFGFFFPQITSGPIPRASGLLPQLACCPTNEDRMAGLRMIAYGLFKKCVVANRLAIYVASIFDTPAGKETVPVVLGVFFNALQLYADFSGYVDIAIGSARILGIRLDPNFDRPYVSTSVTEFWRRWHITLAFWLRDYLYMPLVLRVRNLGRWGIALAMLLTFAICGLWHGATWTFLLFGVSQGVALSAELLTKQWRSKRLKRLPKRAVLMAGAGYTLLFFALTQVIFRSKDLAHAGAVFSRLIHPRFASNLHDFFGIGPVSGPYHLAFYGGSVAVWLAIAWLYRRTSDAMTPWFVGLCAILILFLGALGTAHFIYAAF